MKKITLLLVIFLSLQHILYAGDIKIGFTTSYNRSIHDVGTPFFFDTLGLPHDNIVGTGASPNSGIIDKSGYSFGIVMEVPFFNSSLYSMIVKVSYDHLPGNSRVGDYYQQRLVPQVNLSNPNDTTWDNVTTSTSLFLDVQYSLLTGSILFKADPFDINLSILAGINASYVANKHLTCSYSLISPANEQFKANTGVEISPDKRTMYIRNDDMPEAVKYRLGISAGLQYDIVLGKFEVSPFILANLPLTYLEKRNQKDELVFYNSFKSINWKTYIVQFGLDIIIPF